MMVLYSPDWTNTGFSFILLTVNPFRHSTLTEHGLYRVAMICNKTKIYIRAVIAFLLLKKINTKETHNCMVKTLGENYTSLQ